MNTSRRREFTKTEITIKVFRTYINLPRNYGNMQVTWLASVQGAKVCKFYIFKIRFLWHLVKHGFLLLLRDHYIWISIFNFENLNKSKVLLTCLTIPFYCYRLAVEVIAIAVHMAETYLLYADLQKRKDGGKCWSILERDHSTKL